MIVLTSPMDITASPCDTASTPSVVQACRYRRTAIGVKTANRSADQANAKVTSLAEPTNTDRTASTIGVIGCYFAKGCSQPGMELTGTYTLEMKAKAIMDMP
jgi:hypothetical protein